MERPDALTQAVDAMKEDASVFETGKAWTHLNNQPRQTREMPRVSEYQSLLGELARQGREALEGGVNSLNAIRPTEQLALVRERLAALLSEAHKIRREQRGTNLEALADLKGNNDRLELVQRMHREFESATNAGLRSSERHIEYAKVEARKLATDRFDVPEVFEMRLRRLGEVAFGAVARNDAQLKELVQRAREALRAAHLGSADPLRAEHASLAVDVRLLSGTIDELMDAIALRPEHGVGRASIISTDDIAEVLRSRFFGFGFEAGSLAGKAGSFFADVANKSSAPVEYRRINQNILIDLYAIPYLLGALAHIYAIGLAIETSETSDLQTMESVHSPAEKESAIEPQPHGHEIEQPHIQFSTPTNATLSTSYASDTFDVFLSYAHADVQAVTELVQCLEEDGCRVWWDRSGIRPFAAITQSIETGLAQSKLFLAWYSLAYPASRACQMELTAAFLRAQREGDVRACVQVLNPEQSFDHIHPIQLRDANVPSTSNLRETARSICSRARSIEAPLPAVPPSSPAWYGAHPATFPRFVGRLRELWQVHSLLSAGDASMISQNPRAGDVVQLCGMGGLGKTLLAQEYCRQFGSAYPGGIFWLSAGFRPGAEAEEGRRAQLAGLALLIGLAVQRRSWSEIEADLRNTIEQKGLRYLWVVDDMPEGIDFAAFEHWASPGGGFGRTLVTTRSCSYDGIGSTLNLSVLSLDEAYDLLTWRRKPHGTEETTAATEIVKKLGSHPLALDVAGAAIAVTGSVSFAMFNRRLDDSDDDVLALASSLTGMLPAGHESNIARTLSRSIDAVSPDARAILIAATLLDAVPIPDDLLLPLVSPQSSTQTMEMMAGLAAIHELTSQGLAEASEDPPSHSVHPLVVRIVRFHHYDGAVAARVRDTLTEALTCKIPRVLGDTTFENSLNLYVRHAKIIVGDASSLNDARLLGAIAKVESFFGNQRISAQLYGRRRDIVDRELTRKTVEYWDAYEDAVLTYWYDYARATELMDELEWVLRSRLRLQGPSDSATLATLERYCTVMTRSGHFARARRITHKVYERCLKRLGRDAEATLRAGDTHADAMGASPDDVSREWAREYRKCAFQERRQLYGDDDERTIASAFCLEGASHEQRVYWARKSYALTRMKYGDAHSKTNDARTALADALEKSAEAESLMQESLLFSEIHLGLKHESTVLTASNFADLLEYRGDTDRADSVRVKYLGWIRDSSSADLSPSVRLVQLKLGPYQFGQLTFDLVTPVEDRFSWHRLRRRLSWPW